MFREPGFACFLLSRLTPVLERRKLKELRQKLDCWVCFSFLETKHEINVSLRVCYCLLHISLYLYCVQLKLDNTSLYVHSSDPDVVEVDDDDDDDDDRQLLY